MNSRSPMHTLGLVLQPKPGLAEIEAIINLFPDAVFVIDIRHGTVVLGNSKASEFSSYTRSELTGLPLNALFYSRDDQEKRIPELLAQTDQEFTLDILRYGGNRIPCILKSASLTPSKRYYLLTAETITAYEQAQQGLNRQELLWNTIRDLANASIKPEINEAVSLVLKACTDLTGGVYASVYQARGDQPIFDKLIQLGDLDQFPEQLSPSDVASLRSSSIWITGKRATSSLQRTARSINLSYLASMPIGEENATVGLLLVAGFSTPDTQYLESVMSIMASYLVSLFQGFTLVRQMQQEIQAHQRSQFIASVIQSTVDEGVINLTPELLITSINQAGEDYLGYSNAEVEGQPIDKILIGIEDLTPAFTSALRGRNYKSIDNLKLYRRNGILFPASLKLMPIIIKDVLQNILVIFQDLSEQEEYRTRNQQLEQRALLGEVTASFAHEVRNPINNISTGLQLLAYNLPPGDPNQDNIHRLQVDCERLADLVKSSLSFVRPMEYKLEAINFSTYLATTLDRWKPRLERNNIKPHLQVEEDLPLVEGDIRALDQVFTNLINNAIQAMDSKGGVLAMKARRVQDHAITSHIEISLSDTGPGIPPEVRDRIFEPFFTTKQSGTGLGLAIVKRIVTAHKGAIHVNSVPGGTIFSIILPAIREAKFTYGET